MRNQWMSLAFVLLTATTASAQSVPFEGAASGQDVSVTLEASGIRIIARADGTATGVGAFTEVLDYVLSYDLVNLAGTGVITARNGDQLTLAFQGTIPGFAAQVFPLRYSGTFVITGGTGRFEGNSGTGALDGIDYGAGAFDFTFNAIRELHATAHR